MKFSKLYKNWPVHNVIGHPLMQVFNSLGLHVAAIMVHECTLPEEQVPMENSSVVGTSTKLSTVTRTHNVVK